VAVFVRADDALEADVEDRGVEGKDTLEGKGKRASAHGESEPEAALVEKRCALFIGDGADVGLA